MWRVLALGFSTADMSCIEGRLMESSKFKILTRFFQLRSKLLWVLECNWLGGGCNTGELAYLSRGLLLLHNG